MKKPHGILIFSLCYMGKYDLHTLPGDVEVGTLQAAVEKLLGVYSYDKH